MIKSRSKNNSLGFPISYRDNPVNDGNRFSDKFLIVTQSKKFQDISSALFSIIFIVGQQPRVANAIPVEAGECVADLADTVVNGGQAGPLVPDVGRAAAAAANQPAPGPLKPLGQGNNLPTAPVYGTPGTPPGPGGPPKPGQPPIYIPLGRPHTSLARGANSFYFTASIVGICLNAYWGNPVVLAGCGSMIVTWMWHALGINIKGG